jgi:hypothetical protein
MRPCSFSWACFSGPRIENDWPKRGKAPKRLVSPVISLDIRAPGSPREGVASSHANLLELRSRELLANLTAIESVWVELLAGDPATAADFGAEGCRLHEELGEQRFLANAAGPWRRRSRRSTGSRRQTPGSAAQRSSARATRCGCRCSGDR